MNFYGLDLSGWNFAGQDLMGASIENANLAGANFAGRNLARASISYHHIAGAGFQLCRPRGTQNLYVPTNATIRNTILFDGSMQGLRLADHEFFVIRDYDRIALSIFVPSFQFA